MTFGEERTTMGKQSKGGKGSGSSAAATAAKKCTCDHPYNCGCGNRPERPSKGHKWYPEEQIWAGKGHKQKGASGQTASIGEAALVTAKGQTSVAQWQRLPSQLLREYCQRQKRPLPKYKNIEKSSGKFKYRVILPDPKGDDQKDLFFVLPNAVPNEEQAQEEGALLALLQLTPSLPHERKLPEPYKTSWLHAVRASKKASSLSIPASTDSKNDNNNNSLPSSSSAATVAVASTNLALGLRTSATEQRRQREEQRQQRNARIRRHDAIRLANKNHPVFMSARLRQQIQALLRSVPAESTDQSDAFVEFDPAAAAAAADYDDEDDFDDEYVSDAQASVEHRLHSEGFTKRQARTAYQAWSSTSSMNDKQQLENEDAWDSIYERCLQWLLLHLDEDQLPEGFDPRGRTLDVIVPVSVAAGIDPLSAGNGVDSNIGNNNNNNTDNNDVMATSHHIDLAARLGICVKEAQLIYELAAQNIVSPLDIFWQTVQKAAAVSGTGEEVFRPDASAGPTTDEMSTATELLQEECEALEAIFGDDCGFDRSDEGVTGIRLPLESRNLSLEVLVRDGLYPHVPPLRVLVTGQSWPSRMGAALHVALSRFLLDLPLGEPMVFALHAQTQDLLLMMPKQSATLSLLPFLGGDDYIGDNAFREARAAPFSSKAPNTLETKRNSSSSDRLAASVPRRRPGPRGRSFWTIPPKETPPATAFPTVNAAMKRTRDALPAAKMRDEFLTVMNKAIGVGNRVMLVSGETGSGKSTQLPAYILENDPKGAKIVVAQPRRLAATGLASRVAEERGEPQAGSDSVGYVVRGDSAMSLRTRLVFCTTGVLLRQLQNEGALDCVTHIVVDEVHERQLDSDVLLGFLRKSLADFPNLFVILMSATMDSERFARYWGSNTPHIHLPGRTFPVTDYVLEDVLSLTGYVPPKKKKGGRTKYNHTNKERKTSPWNDSEVSDCEEDDQVDNKEEIALEKEHCAAVAIHIPLELLLERIDETTVDPDLICCLIRHIVRNRTSKDEGSILVFLPGVPEINNTLETIRRGTKDLALVLLPLHGGLQPKEQRGVFQRAPSGYTKVVCSTNVAETSITIPDCTVVIDCCREKQASYDPVNRMPLLVEQFASKASLKQRRGRAGRVREGVSYKLISRSTLFGLKDHSDPEIRRVALDQTLVQLLFLGVETGAGEFMQTLLDPPSRESLEAAAFNLTKMGAVEKGSNEGELQLTPLGNHIAGIPAPPIVGKMLVMGAILGCRSAALGMAAGISLGRSPFVRIDDHRLSRGKNNEEMSMEDIKRQRTLEERSRYSKMVGYSDHAILAALFLKWKETGAGGEARKIFCDSLGLSFTAMRDMLQVANQLDGSLKAAGFVPTPESDRNGKCWRIIRTCAVSAMAPSHLVKIRRPAAKYLDTAEGARAKDSEAKELKLFIRTENAQEERVFIHPASANFSKGTYSCPILVYNSMVRTSKPFLRDVTECSVYSLLLFGGILEVISSKGTIVIDGWVELSANARIGALIGGLRMRVDKLMTEKAKDPSFDIAGSKEMQLIVKLIASDGLG